MLLCTIPCAVYAQVPPATEEQPQQSVEQGDEELSAASTKVDVTPQADDKAIAKRLQRVLEATEWFKDPGVRVDEGVVFLSGEAQTEELKKWAGDLARKTQDVVAVANRMEVAVPPLWDFTPAKTGLATLWRDSVRALPFIAFGALVVAISLGVGLLVTQWVKHGLRKRIRTRLLLNVIARTLGILVFLIGIYIVLRVAGLTQLALSIVGGTGLIGLAFGIAFRDITENFLASIFLSMQRPFQTGDLVEVSDVTGYVQQLNIRTTIVMTLDGHIVQIPNAIVYKNNLCNYSTNTNRREDFTVGIGYDDSINEAQQIARKVLADHPAVLNDPEPSVLADSMGQSTINLRIYFWLNGREHSWLKVRSSVIRLIKLAFQEHGISMPDEAREIVFPQGVPVRMLNGDSKSQEAPGRSAEPRATRPEKDVAAVSTDAEAGLYSEAKVIQDQARHVRPLEEENLLRTSQNGDESESPANPSKAD